MTRREIDPSSRSEAYRTALRLLDRQDRTTTDLRGRLRARGYHDDTVESAIERLTEAQLLDDARFAARFVEQAASGRGLGSRRVRMDLKRRGLDDEQATVASLELAPGDAARAEELAAVRATRLRNIEPQAAIRRIAGFLARKGYAPGLCWDAARKAVHASLSAPTPPD